MENFKQRESNYDAKLEFELNAFFSKLFKVIKHHVNYKLENYTELMKSDDIKRYEKIVELSGYSIEKFEMANQTLKEFFIIRNTKEADIKIRISFDT